MVGVAFLLLLLAGVPIAFVLLFSANLYIASTGNEALFLSVPQQVFGGLESYGLLAIPLFMLTGEVMNEGGLTHRLIRLAALFVNGFRAGLAYVNIIANMMMASIMGSAVAQIAVMSKVMVPEMEKAGYDRAFAGALTAAGGLLSPIIPPSMLFVIYGVLAQLPIGDMFIAGIIPGLLLAFGFFLVIALLGFKYTYPISEKMAPRALKAALIGGLPACLIPVVIIGSILLGLATPTEAAALATLLALLIGKYVYRELVLRHLGDLLLKTALTSSCVIFMIAGANLLGWALIFEQIPQTLAHSLTQISQDPLVFLLLVNVGLLFVGMIIDGIACLIMVVPILLPVAMDSYGIDPFHFGVVICLNLVLGLLTPPVGTGLYVGAANAGVTPFTLFKALLPFLVICLLVLLLLIWQPMLTTLFIT